MAVPLAVALGLAVAAIDGKATLALMAAFTLTAGVGAFASASSFGSRDAGGEFLLRVSLGLLGLAAFLITFNALRVTAGLAFADGALVASAGVALIHFTVARNAVLAPPWLVLAGAGLLLAGVVSSAGQADFSGNLLPTVRFTIALTLTPMLIGALTDGPDARRLIIGAWVLSAAANAAVGLSDFVGLTEVGSQFFPDNSTGRVNGLTSHPNHLGLACAMTIPVVLWCLRAPKEGAPFGRTTSGVLLALLAGGVYLSGSRAALVGAAAGCAFTVLLAARTARAAVGVLVLFAVVTAMVSIAPSLAVDQTGDPNVFERLRGDPGAQESDAGRLISFVEAQRAFTSRPIFGNGFEQVLGAHDIYLQLLQAGGLVAFIAFGLFAVGTLRLGSDLRRKDHSSQDLVAGLMAAMCVWLVAGLFQNAIYDRYLYVPAGLLLGLAVASLRSDERKGQASVFRGRVQAGR